MATSKAVLFGDDRFNDRGNVVLESWPVASFDRPDCSMGGNAGTGEVHLTRQCSPAHPLRAGRVGR